MRQWMGFFIVCMNLQQHGGLQLMQMIFSEKNPVPGCLDSGVCGLGTTVSPVWAQNKVF